jgi:protein-S-isoprenylcysteine O-methyltransferase Ste14
VNTLRYVLAVLLIVTVPPAVFVWFVIHPFVRFWRRLGPGWTYAVLAVPWIASMGLLFHARSVLLGADFGTRWALVAVGVAVFAGALALGFTRRRQLTMSILSGIPELRGGDPGRLLTEGVYARLRHPRYVEVMLSVVGYALVANYRGGYVVVVLTVASMVPLIILEERELRDRFGVAYDEYARRVPRFIPRW